MADQNAGEKNVPADLTEPTDKAAKKNVPAATNTKKPQVNTGAKGPAVEKNFAAAAPSVLPVLELAVDSELVPLARVTELAYAGAPEGAGVVVRSSSVPDEAGESDKSDGQKSDDRASVADTSQINAAGAQQVGTPQSAAAGAQQVETPQSPAGEEQQANTFDLLRLAILLRPQVPMRQLVAVEPVAAMALLDALEDMGADPQSIGIAWPHDVVLSEDFSPVAAISTKAGYSDGMFVSLAIDVQVDALNQLFANDGKDGACQSSPFGQGQPVTAAGNANPADRLAGAIQRRMIAAMRSWEAQAATPNAKAGPWAPFLPAYFDRVPLLGQPVNVCYPNGRVYARGLFVGIDIWGRATVRTRRAGDIEFPAEKFVIRPQSY